MNFLEEVEAENVESKPPNYREADCCGFCLHWSGDFESYFGKCRKHITAEGKRVEITADMICDDYTDY